MKRLSVAVALIVILLLPAISLSCSGNLHASLGQQFTLPVGKIAEISGESLTIKFLQVTADSRCPTGATCIWAGEAKCLMEITLNGVTSEKTFTISASGAPEEFDQYIFGLKLEPYPELYKEIAPSDYRLAVTVTRL